MGWWKDAEKEETKVEEREEWKGEDHDTNDDPDDEMRRNLSRLNQRRHRLRGYEEEVLCLNETGATLREAWSEILMSSQLKITDLTEKLDFARSRRDDARYKLREFKQKAATETQNLIDELTVAKIEKAQIALEIDQLKLKMQQHTTTPNRSLQSADKERASFAWPTE